MNPIVRLLGKVLRLVGISSPEDNLPRPKDAADPPSWRDGPASGAKTSEPATRERLAKPELTETD